MHTAHLGLTQGNLFVVGGAYFSFFLKAPTLFLLVQVRPPQLDRNSGWHILEGILHKSHVRNVAAIST